MRHKQFSIEAQNEKPTAFGPQLQALGETNGYHPLLVVCV